MAPCDPPTRVAGIAFGQTPSRIHLLRFATRNSTALDSRLPAAIGLAVQVTMEPDPEPVRCPHDCWSCITRIYTTDVHSAALIDPDRCAYLVGHWRWSTRCAHVCLDCEEEQYTVQIQAAGDTSAAPAPASAAPAPASVPLPDPWFAATEPRTM